MSDSSVAIVCSSVVSIVSVCIPLMIILFNNRQSRKMKELELNYENKLNAYKEFFSEYGKYVAVTSYQNLQSLGEKVSNAILFAPLHIREKLFIILKFCETTDTPKALKIKEIENAYLEVTNLIANDLENSQTFFNARRHKSPK